MISQLLLDQGHHRHHCCSIMVAVTLTLWPLPWPPSLHCEHCHTCHRHRRSRYRVAVIGPRHVTAASSSLRPPRCGRSRCLIFVGITTVAIGIASVLVVVVIALCGFFFGFSKRWWRSQSRSRVVVIGITVIGLETLCRPAGAARLERRVYTTLNFPGMVVVDEFV